MLLHELVPIGLGARADGFRLEEAPFLQGELEPGEPVEKVEGQIAKVLIDFVSAHRSRAPDGWAGGPYAAVDTRSEEHTSELQSLMRISYAVFCLKTNTIKETQHTYDTTT